MRKILQLYNGKYEAEGNQTVDKNAEFYALMTKQFFNDKTPETEMKQKVLDVESVDDQISRDLNLMKKNTLGDVEESLRGAFSIMSAI